MAASGTEPAAYRPRTGPDLVTKGYQVVTQ
jgi:hypothetical protein